MLIMFTGQGSQHVGMGKDFYQSFPQAKNVFERVSDALSHPMDRCLFKAPDLLDRTEWAQPAILTVSLAITAVLQDIFPEVFRPHPDLFLSGHSVGEYSALVAGSSLNLEHAAHLLRIRGNAMQVACQPGQGCMIAILGWLSERVESVLQEYKGDGICQIANDNGGKQVVISGETQITRFIAEKCKELGAKTISLNVSGSFHSPLMAQAVPPMRRALSSTPFVKPVFPVFSNVTARPYRSVTEIRHLLARQITSTVRWDDTIQFAHNTLEIRDYLEIGPLPTLAKLVKRSFPASRTMSLCKTEHLKLMENFLIEKRSLNPQNQA